MDPYILMLGCFDTKGEVFSYLRNCLLAEGERVVTMNTGILGTTDLFPVDIEANVVAEEGGGTLALLAQANNRGHAVDVMGKGAAKIISMLISEGGVKAAVGMGGGGGTYIVLSALKQIPVGIPKLCLSTLAAKDLTVQTGGKDILLMPSVVDLAGLNHISRGLIRQAAAAVTAMGNLAPIAEREVPGRIAISMFGNTTACVEQCGSLLRKLGYEVFEFHANGIGGMTMESLIREGVFDAVLDITTTELADELCGGICSAGVHRLETAGEMAIPQVVVPGCLDMVNFGPQGTVPEKYRSRDLYSWAPDVTLMRTNREENVQLARILTTKLNQASGPVAILLPLKGLSQIDSLDGVFYRPEINGALFNEIKRNANDSIKVQEVDLHINHPKFAEIAVKALLEAIEVFKMNQLKN